jgi:succinylglutamate desuccinylase
VKGTDARAGAELSMKRTIGQIRGAEAGPTLVVVGSLHGNEPGGTRAAERVLDRIVADRVPLRGEVVALSGNVASLRLGRRYQVKDLNRQWTNEKVEALRVRDPALDDAEDAEQRELLLHVEAAIGRARGDVYLVDLHTTSAAGYPFVLFGDTLPQRDFAIHLPLPIILGLEEQVDGVLSEHMTRRGLVTYAVEGGQHDDPSSIDNLAAVLWVALSGAGLVRREDNPELAASLAHLERARGDIPRVLEVLSRHAIRTGDGFRMEPGFANLAAVERGRLLATDAKGEIRAPHDGFVMLPLYQGQGDDGFFWGRAVGSSRLRASRLARRLHVDRVLPLLPGVSRDPRHDDRLRVDTRVARLYPLDVFHFFGFRKVRQEGSVLTMERSRH